MYFSFLSKPSLVNSPLKLHIDSIQITEALGVTNLLSFRREGEIGEVSTPTRVCASGRIRTNPNVAEHRVEMASCFYTLSLSNNRPYRRHSLRHKIR